MRPSLLFLPLLALSTAELSARVLIFPEDGIRVLHDHTDTRYVRNDGKGSSPENAPTFYVPIASSNNSPYLTTPELSASLISGNTDRSVISIPVEVSIISANGQTLDAFVAAKKNGSAEYQVIHNHPAVADEDDIDLRPDLKDICDADGSLEIDCTPFQTGGSGKEEIALFLAIGIRGEVDAAPGSDSIDPNDYADGVHLKLKLSSVISAAPQKLTGLYKGDGRIRAQFDLKVDNIEDGDSLYAYIQEKDAIGDDNCKNSGNAPSRAYGTLPADEGEHKKLHFLAGSGTVAIKNLKNGSCYSVQIYYRDKYRFASQLSDGLNSSPELLEKLLRQNSCFLLTAGFGGEDPIVNDFRHFRDHTLRRSPLGRTFIRLYYSWAPALAPGVAASPLLSALVRGAAQVFHRLFLPAVKVQP